MCFFFLVLTSCLMKQIINQSFSRTEEPFLWTIQVNLWLNFRTTSPQVTENGSCRAGVVEHASERSVHEWVRELQRERERGREGVKIIHLKPILLLKLISVLNGLTSSETSNLRAGEKTFCFSFFLTELFVVSSSNPNRRRDFLNFHFHREVKESCSIKLQTTEKVWWARVSSQWIMLLETQWC